MVEVVVGRGDGFRAKFMLKVNNNTAYHRAWFILQFIQVIFSRPHLGEVVNNSKLEINKINPFQYGLSE